MVGITRDNILCLKIRSHFAATLQRRSWFGNFLHRCNSAVYRCQRAFPAARNSHFLLLLQPALLQLFCIASWSHSAALQQRCSFRTGLLRKGASKNIKVFIIFRFTEFEKMLPFYKNISVQISTKRRIDWNVSTCENVKLLCLEFMLESVEEQHGLILWILVVMFFFFVKSCKLQLNILFVCLFFLVKVSKRDV